MAVITSFSTLKTAVLDWLERADDTTMAATGGPVDVMIDLAEDKIYRKLRLRFMEASTSPTIASGVVAVPSDFLELKQAHVVTNPVTRLEPKNAEWIYANYPQRSADSTPQFIAQEGEEFIFGPYPDANKDVTLRYYQRPAALSLTNETNWLTTHASDILLNGALLESIGYLGMDERVPYWQAAYNEQMRELETQRRDEQFGMGQAIRAVPG